MSRAKENGSEDEVALTPGESIAALYLKEHMADVHFTCTDQEGTVTRLPAHKFVLATASRTFYTQFFGSLPDQNEIHIEEEWIEADTFKLLLKYFYCSAVQLDTEQAPKLLYLAKKYLLKVLEIKCRTFVNDQLYEYSDWCLHLLQYLHAALGESESTLIETVLQLIDSEGECAVTSDQFCELSAEVVSLIVRRDTLDIEELTLFKMVIKWSKRECERKNLPATLDNQHALLQEIIPHIRFTRVSRDDLCSMMRVCRILSNDMIVDILLTENTTALPFNSRPRANQSSNLVYIIGGDVNESINASVRTYSLDTGCQLTQMQMKEQRAWHCAAYCHTSKQMLVIGGCRSGAKGSAEICSMSEDKPVFSTIPMNNARSQASCICIGNNVYVMGGLTRSCECYDVTLGTWTDLRPLPHPVKQACCVLYEDGDKTTILLFGGRNSDTRVVLQTVLQYWPDENQWTGRPDLRLPTPLFLAAAVNWCGKVVLVGGSTQTEYEESTNTCYSLDSVTKQWISMPSLKTKRWGHAAVVVGGKIVVMGGKDDDHDLLKSVEVYDGKQWTDAAELYAGTYGFAAFVV